MMRKPVVAMLKPTASFLILIFCLTSSSAFLGNKPQCATRAFVSSRRSPNALSRLKRTSFGSTDEGGDGISPATTSDQPQQTPAAPTIWSSSWFPLAFAADTDRRRPTRHLLLGAPVVVWHHDGVWRALLDRCPHRLVPLSEGRVVPETGHIECPYHGFCFDGADGRCTRVPQAPGGDASSLPDVETRGRAASLPCEERQGILWVHPSPLFPVDGGGGGEGTPRPAAEPNPADIERYLVDAIDRPGVLHIDYFRDLPMEWSTLVENVMDPCHLPFTHHGTISRRTAAGPVPLRLRRPADASGVSAVRDTSPPGSLDYVAPHLVLSETDRSAGGSFRDWNVAYAVPTEPGRCRLLVRIAFEVSAMRPPLRYVFSALFRLPRWMLHLSNHRILEDDNVFLHRQMHNYRSLARDGVAFEDGTYLPTDADRAVVAFHRWMRERGDAGAMWSPYGPPPPGTAASPSDAALPRDALIERGTAHTDACASCSGARRRLREVVEPALGVASVVCAARAFGGARGVRMVEGLLAGIFFLAKRRVGAIVRNMEVGIWPPPRNQ